MRCCSSGILYAIKPPVVIVARTELFSTVSRVIDISAPAIAAEVMPTTCPVVDEVLSKLIFLTVFLSTRTVEVINGPSDMPLSKVPAAVEPDVTRMLFVAAPDGSAFL